MRGTWNTGVRLFGVPLKIHWTTLLWPLMLWSLGWLAGLQVFLILMASLLIHECAHVLAARTFGCRTEDITIFILGGAARMPGLMTIGPGKEAFMAAMGPIASFMLAGVCFVAATMLGKAAPWALSYAVTLNLVFGIFNILPVYPMDGGRILRAGLSAKLGRRRGTKIAAWTTTVLGIALGALAIYFGWWLAAVIMPIMILAAWGEVRMLDDLERAEGIAASMKERLGLDAADLEFVEGQWRIRFRKKNEAP